VAEVNVWFALPGSTAKNQIFLTIDPTQSNELFSCYCP